MARGQYVPYEALSWSWGRQDDPHHSRIIRVKKGDTAYDFEVSYRLEEALKSLRYKNKDRYLWIDAICINQKNYKERNAQVPQMDRIYGQASNVCIWLGPGDENSDNAIDFISTKILKVWDFDKLCQDELQAKSWSVLIDLMRRDWFSRRWVVQEIALAKRGTLYCGAKHIPWQDFADAVSLFVHVETATHLLSDVMKKAPFSHNVPDSLGDVHALGAALLVDATRNLFRKTTDGRRHPLLSLEHLISKYYVFEASQPRDVIYAFLSIAKDTKPHTFEEEMSGSQDFEMLRIQNELGRRPLTRRILKKLGQRMSAIESYAVNYESPIEDVYRDFLEFSIRKSVKTDPSRALDIICRPWAPSIEDVEGEQESHSDSTPKAPRPLPSWITILDRARFKMIHKPQVGSRMERKNADPLVGLPNIGERSYSAAGSRTLSMVKTRFKSRKKHFAMQVEGFVLDEVGEMVSMSSLGNVPEEWPRFAGWRKRSDEVLDAFWRTLVADRGANGQNPPTFYPRACKEALGVIFEGIPLDARWTIDHGQCTIVADFLRRVQAVIWNRRLMYTKNKRHLGLVPKNAEKGDLVCILYGCSVPVLLRKAKKEDHDIAHCYQVDLQQATNLIKRNWKKRHDIKHVLRKAHTSTAPPTVHSPVNGEQGSGQAADGTAPSEVLDVSTVDPPVSNPPFEPPPESLPQQPTGPPPDQHSVDVVDAVTSQSSSSIQLMQRMFFRLEQLESQLRVGWVVAAMIYSAMWYWAFANITGTNFLSPHLMALFHGYDLTQSQTRQAQYLIICLHLGFLLVLFPFATHMAHNILHPLLQRWVMKQSSRVKATTTAAGSPRAESPAPAANPPSDQGPNPAAPTTSTSEARGTPQSPRLSHPPINSDEWIEMVKEQISTSKFELPWSQDNPEDLDNVKIVREAPESSKFYYTLVGECYVHQMMDGEAIVWQAQDTQSESERIRRRPILFELR